MPIDLLSRPFSTAFLILFSIFLAACGSQENGRNEATVLVDGSSTIFPIAEAVAEEFQIANPNYRVSVGVSGTGGGFSKFIARETDINNASRVIKENEIEALTEAGVEFIELPVAFDGISLVINPQNDFAEYLTVEELNKIWKPGSTVQTWSDVRPEWPDEEITLYAPGADSGTFEYFTEAIMGETGALRADYTASENDNTLVMGVAGDRYALGFFGYAYYRENKDKITSVPIKDGDAEPVYPSPETIATGQYSPLSRPLFAYVKRSAADREEVDEYVKFLLNNIAELASQVGYVGIPEDLSELIRQRYENRVTGSAFAEAGEIHSTEELRALYE